ncbi:OLC1v1014678C1 [Oldenlandia corymbosa var. corymbosa]|uniref:OLC1v1014678C1 n=1 Tax=Oldenlandia corymbosa var. corymbosa TaxID=529605 RepID=A0AAV1E513_OLDCO|nr:OLC1v1014678C1 [Oldenlandia corymbosa var. corymbosa]
MGSLTLVHHKLPTIEFSKENLKPDTESWSKACKQVVSALEEYGCFIAVYDDLSSDVHDSIFNALEELFDLPTETKIQNKSTKPLYGYVGQIPFLPLYESMGIDDANSYQGIDKFANVMWPNGNPSFCEKVLPYTKLAAKLEQVVVRMIFETYGVEKYYECHLKSVGYLSRVMRYTESGEKKLGFVSHTDKSFMSTIHQNQINGLEIKAKDGEWFTVDLPPSAIVVMAGDAIMGWSNNRIQSPHHRVTMEGKGTRYSIAQFSFLEGIVKTPEEFTDDDHPLQFKPFSNLEYLDFFSKEENRRLECALKHFCGV